MAPYAPLIIVHEMLKKLYFNYLHLCILSYRRRQQSYWSKRVKPLTNHDNLHVQSRTTLWNRLYITFYLLSWLESPIQWVHENYFFTNKRLMIVFHTQQKYPVELHLNVLWKNIIPQNLLRCNIQRYPERTFFHDLISSRQKRKFGFQNANKNSLFSPIQRLDGWSCSCSLREPARRRREF